MIDERRMGINLKKNLHYFDRESLFEELKLVSNWYDELEILHDLALDYRIKSIQSAVMIIRREKCLMIYWDSVHCVMTMEKYYSWIN